MSQLGRYEIIEQLGTGAMGNVYRARDTVLDREVALKTIRTGVDVAPEIRQRFYREARACARLQHPNIITVFDMGEADNTAYIAMELLEGADFRKIIQERRPMPVEAKLAACIGVCEAIGHAAKYGVIHRDIKPSNLFLTLEGRSKVLDFGIARLPSSKLTVAGQILGTPNYMAPEQILARPSDGRADLFSAAVVFFEFLTYIHPFQSNFIPRRIVQGEPDSLFDGDSSLPVILEAIFNRALSKEPENRYQTGDEFAADLRTVVDALRGNASPSFRGVHLPSEHAIAPEKPESPPPSENTVAVPAGQDPQEWRLSEALRLLPEFEAAADSRNIAKARGILSELENRLAGDVRFTEALRLCRSRMSQLSPEQISPAPISETPRIPPPAPTWSAPVQPAPPSAFPNFEPTPSEPYFFPSPSSPAQTGYSASSPDRTAPQAAKPASSSMTASSSVLASTPPEPYFFPHAKSPAQQEYAPPSVERPSDQGSTSGAIDLDSTFFASTLRSIPTAPAPPAPLPVEIPAERPAWAPASTVEKPQSPVLPRAAVVTGTSSRPKMLLIVAVVILCAILVLAAGIFLLRPAAPESSIVTATVAVASADILASPMANADKITSAASGSVLNILAIPSSRNQDWVHVQQVKPKTFKAGYIRLAALGDWHTSDPGAALALARLYAPGDSASAEEIRSYVEKLNNLSSRFKTDSASKDARLEAARLLLALAQHQKSSGAAAADWNSTLEAVRQELEPLRSDAAYRSQAAELDQQINQNLNEQPQPKPQEPPPASVVPPPSVLRPDLAGMLAKARDLWHDGDYQGAQRVLGQILRLNPRNKDAKQLSDKIKKAHEAEIK